jgi:hypothetical protein
LLPIEHLVDAPAPEQFGVPEYIPVASRVADATVLATSAIVSGSEGSPPLR